MMTMVKCDCHDKIFDSPASLQNHLDLEAGGLTDTAVQAGLSAVRQGQGPLRAARTAGIPVEVWKREMQTNQVLRDALQLAEEEQAEEVEEALLRRAKNGDF